MGVVLDLHEWTVCVVSTTGVMSRDSFCFDGQMAPGFAEQGFRHFAPPRPDDRSPVPSHLSAGFDSSAFGSGSSVLSAFEPPNDAELMEKTSLSQTFDDSVLFSSSLVIHPCYFSKAVLMCRL